ncbi:MAG: hypothetical protein DHS80DRAFT_17501 [Piptocephalis tieghemiana]|nr:MAG: hypothetical protein DHS80DRAFT_17501 [Piptocephalis tieghemiana]
MLTITGRKRYCLGLLALLAVVVIWVGSSFAVNSIFTDQAYNKPFFLTYLNTGTFSFYLVIYAVRTQWKKYRSSSRPRALTRQERSSSQNYGSIERKQEDGLVQGSDVHASSQDDMLSQWQVIKLSLAFCILWFLANWCSNASFAYTTVASGTILASTSSLFTLLIGVIFGTEKFTLIKCLAVFGSIGGVVCVSLSDLSNNSLTGSDVALTLRGDILALIGAALYGAYTVLLKRGMGDESRVDMSLFFGFVGIFNLVLLWPIFFIFHYTGVETFELPSTQLIWAMLIVNALVGTFLSDYLWLLAMLMTSPLVVTLGLSLTIPLALVGDIVGKGIQVNGLYWVGAALVLLGFLGVNGAEVVDSKKKDQQQDEEEEEEEESRRMDKMDMSSSFRSDQTYSRH